MSNTVIEDLRWERSRLDEIDARCAKRRALIDRLKAERCGTDPFRGWSRMGRSDRDDPLATTAPGRRFGGR